MCVVTHNDDGELVRLARRGRKRDDWLSRRDKINCKQRQRRPARQEREKKNNNAEEGIPNDAESDRAGGTWE